MKCQGTDHLRPKVSYKCFVFTWVGIELNVPISVNPQHFIPFSRIHLDSLTSSTFQAHLQPYTNQFLSLSPPCSICPSATNNTLVAASHHPSLHYCCHLSQSFLIKFPNLQICVISTSPSNLCVHLYLPLPYLAQSAHQPPCHLFTILNYDLPHW